MKATRRFLVSLILLTAGLFQNAWAAEKATPAEVYQMVLKGMEVMQQLGEEGLAAFNQKGEFAWKDSYVGVFNCKNLTIAAHPAKRMIGYDLTKSINAANKKLAKAPGVSMCEAAQNPNGGWVVYTFAKLGSQKLYRKVSFTIQVPGQPYAVSAGIYDDKITLEELTALTVE